MSTIVVVKKGSTACIAGDTLIKYGNIKESAKYVVNHNKIHKLGDSYFGSVGPLATGFMIGNLFKRKSTKPDFSTVDRIYETFRRIHPTLKKEFYINPDEDEEDSFESSVIQAVIANKHGIFGVYRHREAIEYAKFYAIGSGAEIALGALFACYDELDTSEAIARKGVEAAAEFDDATGFPVIAYTIDLER